MCAGLWTSTAIAQVNATDRDVSHRSTAQTNNQFQQNASSDGKRPGDPDADHAEQAVTNELIAHLCRELGNPKWIIRDDAQTELSSILRPFGTEEQRRQCAVARAMLIEHLREVRGNVESRNRAHVLLKHEFRISPRAAMGIQFMPVNGRPAVSRTIGGFDSERVLRAGDTFVKLANVAVTTREDVQAVICSHLPGESCDVEVIRDGKSIETSLTLGSYTDLNQATEILDPIFELGWALRLARLTSAEQTEPVVPQEYAPDLDPLNSNPVSQPTTQRLADADTANDVAQINLGLMAGGESGAIDGSRYRDQRQAREAEYRAVDKSIQLLERKIELCNTALGDQKQTKAQQAETEAQKRRLERDLNRQLERKANLEKQLGLSTSR